MRFTILQNYTVNAAPRLNMNKKIHNKLATVYASNKTLQLSVKSLKHIFSGQKQ